MRLSHSLSPVLRVASTFALASSLVHCASNDGSTSSPSARESDGTAASALYGDRNATTWSGPIPVCWATSGWDHEKAVARKAILQSWSRVANLEFDGWSDCPASGSFVKIDIGPHQFLGQPSDHSGDGQTVGTGRAVLSAPGEGAKVHFWFQPDHSTYDWVVQYIAVHEFGHVLGYAHEQDRPGPEAIACRTRLCSGQSQVPFDQCMANAATDEDGIQITPYDPSSVMNYCGPTQGTLSPLDIKGVQFTYGARPSAVALGSPSGRPLRADFDGDGRIDVASWAPATGIWSIIASETHATSTTGWGDPNDIPAPADFDGDGKADIAVFRPSNGFWYIIQSASNAQFGFGWGNPTDVPVPGDYDGDGKADIAVYRPSNATFYVVKSSGGYATTAVGAPYSTPVLMDHDGDGKIDPTTYASNLWSFADSGTGQITTFHWGDAGDLPIAADFDGDKRTDLGVYRPLTGTWYVVDSGGGTLTVGWGNPNDVPLAGDFDGDGKADVVVQRPSNATWYADGISL